ncbi:MAG TPA: hypothetical protein DEV81_12715 [Cyanobacteria bacterium UBA11049]|nr:hypothetical protein [Cyanobacteria bacterium UBA11049]
MFVVVIPHSQITKQNTSHLQDLLSPAIYAQSGYYRSLGLRERILNLTLMVAAVLTLIWRQVPSVQELARMLEQQELLWGKAVKVSQQALSQRFLSFPASLFERVLHDLLPLLQARWHTRQQRPLPTAVKWAHSHWEQREKVSFGSMKGLTLRRLSNLMMHLRQKKVEFPREMCVWLKCQFVGNAYHKQNQQKYTSYSRFKQIAIRVYGSARSGLVIG